MTDVPTPQELLPELEQSQESAARLLKNLAQQLKAVPGVRRVARYGQAQARTGAAGIESFTRRNPLCAVAAAVAIGFLVGRAVRSLGPST